MTKINNVFLNFRIENLAKVFPHMVRNCCKYCEITFGHNIVFDHDRKNIYFLFNLFFQDDGDDDNVNGFIRILDNLLINLFSSKNNLKARRENCRSYNSLKVVSLKAASSLP